MFRCFVLILLLLLSFSVTGQIAGIAATKVTAYNATPITKHTAEFEPTYNTFWTDSFWSENQLIKSDTTNFSSIVNWRISYGLTDDIELGLQTDANVSYSNLAIKAKIYEKDVLALGVMVGVGIPLANRNTDKKNKGINDVSNYGIGVIGSYEINDKNSIDVNVQFQNYFDQLDGILGPAFFVSADWGSYSIADNLQIIFSAGYQAGKSDNIKNKLFSIYPGISIETAKNFAIAIAASQGIFGKNIEKGFGLGVSFTTFWQ